MTQIVMALDQGTSSSRTLLINQSQEIIASASQIFDSHYPQAGWVEQDPNQIWQSQKNTLFEALAQAQLDLGQISAIGITNQRETTIAWNKETGEPLCQSIVWQCRRTAEFCQKLKAQGHEALFKEKTGLVLDPYFSGTKMRWIIDNVGGAKELAGLGLLAFGTVDSWLIWNLTQGKTHATDPSNASRTLLYNIHTGQWDPELLEILQIPASTLPQVLPSSGVIAHTDSSFGAEVPIAGVAGDQQASLFGQACFEAGESKNTYGTGCFFLMNTGHTAIPSNRGLLTTIAWQIGSEVTYALEGSVFIAGALIQWLRDQLQLFENAADTEPMALEVKDNGGVYIVPAFVGLGAPHWDPYARGSIFGLTRDSNAKHIVRAALEAICYQSYDLLQAAKQDTGIEIPSLKVDGGAVANGFLCQFQADLLQSEVSRPINIEATAMGAAFLAGLATGVWSNLEEIRQGWKEDQCFVPQLEPKEVEQLLQGWVKALDRSKGWASPDLS